MDPALMTLAAAQGHQASTEKTIQAADCGKWVIKGNWLKQLAQATGSGDRFQVTGFR